MGVLNSLADLDEETQALFECKTILGAILRQRNPIYIFHGEVGVPIFCRAGIEDASNGRVVHHRESIFLRLETGQHIGSIHASTNHLDRQLPMGGVLFLTQINIAEGTTADVFLDRVFIDRLWRCIG